MLQTPTIYQLTAAPLPSPVRRKRSFSPCRSRHGNAASVKADECCLVLLGAGSILSPCRSVPGHEGTTCNSVSRDCMPKHDNSLALSQSSIQMPRHLLREPKPAQKPQHSLERWITVHMKRTMFMPHCAGQPEKLTDMLALRVATILAKDYKQLENRLTLLSLPSSA